MARRTRVEIDAELLLRIANRSDISSAQRLSFIHDAYLSVANSFPHPELQGEGSETINDGDDFLVPTNITDLWWPDFVQNTDTGRPIDMTSMKRIEGMKKVAGQVTEYYWWGQRFRFNRLQDGNLTVGIWYKKKVVELDAADSPAFDEIYDPLIAMRAARMALETVGDQKKADRQEAEFRNYVEVQRLPVFEAEKNDRRKSFVVRTR